MKSHELSDYFQDLSNIIFFSCLYDFIAQPMTYHIQRVCDGHRIRSFFIKQIYFEDLNSEFSHVFEKKQKLKQVEKDSHYVQSYFIILPSNTLLEKFENKLVIASTMIITVTSKTIKDLVSCKQDSTDAVIYSMWYDWEDLENHPFYLAGSCQVQFVISQL